MNKFWVFIVFSLTMGFTNSYAQEQLMRPVDLNSQLDSLFNRGQFWEVKIQALEILRNHNQDEFNLIDEVGAKVFLGFVEVINGNNDLAKTWFHSALETKSDLLLDPIYVPPHIYDVFITAVIESRENQVTEVIEDSTNIEYPSRKPAVIMNFVVPGSGFALEKKPIRALGWSTAQIGSLAMFFVCKQKRDDAREKYLSAGQGDDLESLYNDYNLNYQKTLYWGIASSLVYILSQVDFNIVGYKAEFYTDNGSLTDPSINMGIKLTF